MPKISILIENKYRTDTLLADKQSMLTMRCLLYLVLPLAPLARAQCSLVSVSGCQPDPAEVIKTYIIPGEPTSMCQQLCSDTDQCNLWSYDSGWHCSLLRTSYLATCDNITAGYETDYAQCLAQDSGSCDDLVGRTVSCRAASSGRMTP